MKNTECIIYAKSKKKIVQTMYRNKKGWMQKSSRGNFFWHLQEKAKPL